MGCSKCGNEEWSIDNKKKKVLCQKCGESLKCHKCGDDNWLYVDETTTTQTQELDMKIKNQLNKGMKNLVCINCKTKGASTIIIWNEKTGRTIP